MLHENIDKHFLASIVESSKDSIISVDSENIITCWNKASEALYGCTAAEALGKPLTKLALPESFREILSYIDKIKDSPQIENFQAVRISPPGLPFAFVEVTLSPVENEAGKLIGISVIAREMPDPANRFQWQKDKESVRRSEASLANAQRIAQTGSWEWDIKNNKLTWSDEIYRIFGFSKKQFHDPYETFFNTIHPEDREKVQKARRTALAQISPHTVEYRIIRPNGLGRVVCEIGEVTPDAAGTPLWLIGTVQDITERKAAETEMRLMKSVIDSIVEGIIVSDPRRSDNPTIYANAAFEKLTGYSFEEIKGRNCRILQGIETDRRMVDKMRDAVKNERAFHGEILNYHKNGEPFWNELSISPVFDEAGRLTNYVGVQQDVTERKQAEEALQEAAKRERAMIENALDVICTIDENGRFAAVSPACFKVWGYQPEELLGTVCLEIVAPEDVDKTKRAAVEVMSGGIELKDFENCCTHKNGSQVFMSWTALWSEKDRLTFCVAHDLTATRKLTEQLRQSQKLESVGLLAGGIAHDFNNMLTAINGYSELTLFKLKEDDPLRRNIEEIKKAGARSALLTQQLLAFSRQQFLNPVVLDLNAVILDTITLLERLIGEDIELRTVLNSKVGRVNFDPGQLSQIIINLAVNARDAMPQGGRLTIETANVFLNAEEASRHIGFLPGDYVRLAISDNGRGMSSEIRERVFEPFFTTKEIGKGTGLGLATVYGIVKQSGGGIEVYSVEGRGTTFNVYLPKTAEGEPEILEKSNSDTLTKGTETILLVEDEELVRKLTRQILEDCGYTVFEARNGQEALEICDQNGFQIDLLMTDVVMPKMGGRELGEKMTAKMPNLKILFTSGYTDDAVVRHGVIESKTNFIQKPFSPDELANKIREVLSLEQFL